MKEWLRHFSNPKSKRNKDGYTTYRHSCEIAKEIDPIENCVRNPFLRCWFRMVTVSTKRKNVIKGLRSNAALAKEQVRQIKYHPTSIHPNSDFRIFWEIHVVLVCLFLLTIVLPCFAISSDQAFLKTPMFRFLQGVINLTFVCDVILNLFTGYYSEAKKEVVLTKEDILYNYVTTHFIFDLLTCLPADWTFFGLSEEILHDKRNAFYYITTLLTFSRYFRYTTFIRYNIHVFKHFGFSYEFYSMLLLILTYLLIRHVFAALYLFIYNKFQHSQKDQDDLYDGYTLIERYLDALYHSSVVSSLAGYGIRKPTSMMDAVLTTIVWYVSLALDIFFKGSLVIIIKSRTSSRYKYVQLLMQLKEFMKHRQMPRYLQNRLVAYYHFKFQGRYFVEVEIMKTVSSQLRQEITMHSCRMLVESVTFFRNLPTNQLVRIVSCLKPEIYLTNDVIIRARSVGNEMYFISTGTVAVYTVSGQEICHLEDGQHFGEIALLQERGERVASVIAVEITEIYSLSRSNFVRAIHPYPDLMEKIQRIAADRLEVTTTIDKQHRKELDS